MNIENIMASGYSSVKDFNTCCSNEVNKETLSQEQILQKIKNQAERILEEAQEIIDGVNDRNPQEILDGMCDVLYVTFGLTEMVNNTIGDVGLAFQKVCENNSLKYTHDFNEAMQWLEYYLSSYNPNDTETYSIATSKHYEGFHWFCIKRSSDGKICKPPHFPKVDLSDCLY